MIKPVLLSLLTAVSFSATADWTLSNDDSSINFVSVKKSNVGEVHHFKSLSGSLKGGNASVVIDLTSVETNIDIRNDRMKEMLFEVANFASATISTKVDDAKLSGMKAGESFQQKVTVSLDLHGVTKDVDATVRVTKLSDGGVSVGSVAPVLIKAADFNLDGGVEALRTVAKLPVISTVVPVTFSLVFADE